MNYETYRLFAFAWTGIAILVFLLLLKVTAPYGRHSSRSWGPMISNRVGWIIMELPVFVLLMYFATRVSNNVSLVFIGLFLFHYFNRVFIFPFRIHTKGKQMPLVIALSAICFNLVNGSLLGYYFADFASYPAGYFTHWNFIIGLFLFIAGIFINWKSDNILISLRKPGETGYSIPKGWLFEKISCPNLFGEITEWGGYALMCYNLPALSFFVWTCANLIPRALSHHKWYKSHFHDYPSQRKAVFPYLL